MVKVGFICEGDTEKLVIESPKFQELLKQLEIACVSPVIDAKGNGNLLPDKIEPFRTILMENGAEKIIVLTDLDQDSCITLTRNRIMEKENQAIIVSVKEIEAWFLADSITMSSLLRESFHTEQPEFESDAFHKIKTLSQEKTNRGIGTKPRLAKRIIGLGFSVENAANHPNCPSAKYFIEKLKSVTRK